MLKTVNDLRVIHRSQLLSDHAPTWPYYVSRQHDNLKELECRAERLGDHDILHGQAPKDIFVKP